MVAEYQQELQQQFLECKALALHFLMFRRNGRKSEKAEEKWRVANIVQQMKTALIIMKS
jgi:hypothetical protein